MKRNITMDGAKGKFDSTNILLNIILCVIFDVASIVFIVKAITSNKDIPVSGIVIATILIISGEAIMLRSAKEHGRDNMTTLPNQSRFAFFAVLKMITKKFPQYTVAFINMKDQKYTNRVAGKGNGDYIIISYAHKLRDFLIKGEHIARLGGDNFILLVYKHRVDELLTFLSGINIPYMMEGTAKEIKVSSRAGLYSLEEKDTVFEVFNCPSIALAYAKDNKKDYAWFTKDMVNTLEREKNITCSFDDAIKNKEFVVYYQPKVDVNKSEMYASEALVRWIRNGEIIPPMDFIPVLEQNRMIQKLDFYVLHRVCQDMIEWKENGIPVKPVSVNFSKYHLTDENFAERIISTINEFGLDKNLFQIELTETADYCDANALEKAINEIHEAGITTAIDDFGKGYSSPEHLKNPDIDIIKFDKSFVNGIEANGGQNREATLVKNLIATCIELKKKVVFEGIETVEQRDIVKSMRCDYIQGYLYDKPLKESDFREKLINPVYTR